MKELNVYSTVVGDLPKLVASKTPLTFVPHDDAKWYSDKLIEAVEILEKNWTIQHECLELEKWLESVK